MLGSLLLIASHFYIHPVFSAEHTLVTKRTPLLGGLLLNATLDGLLLNATAHTKLSSICKTFERPMTITVQRKQMTACVTSGGTFPRARPHGNTKKHENATTAPRAKAGENCYGSLKPPTNGG